MYEIHWSSNIILEEYTLERYGTKHNRYNIFLKHHADVNLYLRLLFVSLAQFQVW